MDKKRIKISIRGAVQGVGFRPFIFRLATNSKLTGWVLNSSSGVFIEAEGIKSQLEEFLLKIESQKPHLAIIQSLEYSYLDPIGLKNFIIKESKGSEEISAFILPDIAACEECVREMNDPNNRRYAYPFINCTNCGPRFSIIESLPYDRPNTSMKKFKMCTPCKKEYENPLDRRFHAQPTACPECGPHIELWDQEGNNMSSKQASIENCVDLIKKGKIIALKGLGGYQLLVNARDKKAVQRLRERKNREEKPFAVMYSNLKELEEDCYISALERRLLKSAESPIVLLKKRRVDVSIADNISPGNPFIGAMLPYTPLHTIIMDHLTFPIVATSANLSEEPMVIDENGALEKLRNIADYYLVHNRPIIRPVDDSIVRISGGQELVMRRARGYAPLPLNLDMENQQFVAAGAHLKSTISIGVKDNIYTSQHLGDLESVESLNLYKKVISDFLDIYQVKNKIAVCDIHPNYISTKYFIENFPNIVQVQHHAAHIAACRTENQIRGQVLGVAWDGTGFGEDGTIWGGEFFTSDDETINHVAQFRQFKLPGGDQSIKEPRRSALAILYEIFGNEYIEKDRLLNSMFNLKEINIIKEMLKKDINSPKTSSVGRLFDAVAALIGLRSRISYEGQAAMMLEYVVDNKEDRSYNFEFIQKDKLLIDWAQIIKEIIKDLEKRIKPNVIAAKFHNSLANIIMSVAKHFGLNRVALSGGCFQNAILVEKCIDLLERNNMKVYRHQRIPPNDGGISLGQVVMANQILKNKKIR